jgi:UDP:flavonoid glycosyltransferase YjiC (YdhE family)
VASALKKLTTDPEIRARAAQVGSIVLHEDGARVAADAIERTFGSS